ncbi:MAG: hypothetical protein HY393_00145 [Candidatus Diapherotrites archaeon]|nr:hypothetical protein [Candidatus Diapherotrites archaeon]
MKYAKVSKSNILLKHAKYLMFLQILAGLCIALIAGQYFNFPISLGILGLIKINNFVLAVILGFIGFLHLNKKLMEFERVPC